MPIPMDAYDFVLGPKMPNLPARKPALKMASSKIP